MNGFFVWYNNYKRKLHPLELACIAHTKLTRIHPFSDGNGRTARIVSNFILHKQGYPMFLVDVKERKIYYNSLDESDRGNERDFIKFIFDIIVKQLKSQI
ncbi:MAG: Fic family protein [Candidatus Aenigmarchaeota archaeon]|nr:Fic family protein [Candidatus Aenigmarchaeota archaeon]